jgi:signal transduction histidine kinase
MVNELERELGQAAHGTHHCLVYDTPEEHLAAVVPYVKGGLARGERCLYLADERTPEEMGGALSEHGVRVSEEIRRGALVLQEGRRVGLRSGRFDPAAVVKLLREASDAAVRDGHAGLLVAVEMSWAIGPDPGGGRILEYECLLDRHLPGSRAHALCLYRRGRFAPEVVREALRTHPVAVAGGLVCPNPFHASRALQGRDEFLAVAAHELRTPLTALQLQVEAIRRQAADLGPGVEDLGARADRALRQVRRLGTLVNDLLELPRACDARLELERGPTDLAALAREVAGRIDRPARRPGARIEVCAEGAVLGQWDAARLDQLVTNLLDNAVKFGGEHPIQVRVAAEDRVAVLEVEDHGVGIAEADRERIFERFVRAAPPRNYGGLGLGLFIARRIVEAHGGSIRAAGAPGRGALLRVELPR